MLNKCRRFVSIVFLVHTPQSHSISTHLFQSRAAFLRHPFVTLFSLFSMKCSSVSRQSSLADPIKLLDSVYGPVDSPDFPMPITCAEASLCADGVQRRYLWTDAFGVLSYISLAGRYRAEGNEDEAKKYQEAANALVDVVHRCLGTPKSNKEEDAMTVDTSSPTGYVGLRIGKVQSRKKTDLGMTYDGMYFHYMDKWLLALARSGHAEDGIKIAKSSFPFFFDKRHGGIKWKLSSDASPPDGGHRAVPNDDTLDAYIVFSILEAHRKSNEGPSLKSEIAMLKTALQGYQLHVTDDPLGWGLEILYDQFIDGHPRWRALATLHSKVLDETHLILPFRLYGAMIGAKIAGEIIAPPETVDRLIEISLAHENQAAAGGSEEHFSINRVMLAMCMLCPGALARNPKDPCIVL